MSNDNFDNNEATGVGRGRFGVGMPAAGPEESPTGLRMVDILALPDPLRDTVNWMIRKREVALADLAERLGQDEMAAQSTLSDLVERGFLWETRVGGESRYRVRLAPQRKRQSSVLDI